jgi:AcrR family transcriptional regulator
MERMLAAAAEILETKNFDTLSVNEVVEKAGTSVGAFYGRFADKEALLQALDERFFSEFEEGIEELMEPSRWRERSLDFVVLDVTRFLVGTYGRNRGLLRSLNLKARLR